jgi:hypothetical protein
VIEADSGAAALAACVAHEPRLVLLGALIDEAAHDMDAYNCAAKSAGRSRCSVLSGIEESPDSIGQGTG